MTLPFAAGACQCGEIQYEIAEEPFGVWVCYCTECQKAGAGSSTVTAGVLRKDFVLLKGQPSHWLRFSDAGVKNRANFCGKCGNRIFHDNPDAPEKIRLKTGTLKDIHLEPDAHAWTSRAPSWIQIPDNVLSYESQPTVEEFFAEIDRRRKAGT